jgi:prolipoprotein diacylglyceryl transferase
MTTALPALRSVHDYIPSPSDGVWHVGPVPLRGYALCIIIGIFAAAILADRRYRARGGALGVINEISTWAVPFGLVGGRIYHVATDWSDYFGKGGSPIRSLEVWKGGLGIPGAVAFGGLGVFIACRRRGVLMPPVADAIAPGLVLAQGLGRWGNWFNQELYGRPTSLPWAVRIDAAHQCGVISSNYQPTAVQAECQSGVFSNVYGYFQPTFLYESIWDIGTAIALILLDRRYKLGHGRVFALYLVIYGLGRSWIEALRIDPAHHFFGLRLNDWTSIAIVVAGVIGYLVSARRHPGREVVLVRRAATDDASVEPVVEAAATAEVTETTDVTEPTDVLEPLEPPGDPEPAVAREPIDALDPAMDVDLLFHPVKATEPGTDGEPADAEPMVDAEPVADAEPATVAEDEPSDEPERTAEAELEAADEGEAADESEPKAEADATEEPEPVDEAEPAGENVDENADEVAVGAEQPPSHGGES